MITQSEPWIMIFLDSNHNHAHVWQVQQGIVLQGRHFMCVSPCKIFKGMQVVFWSCEISRLDWMQRVIFGTVEFPVIVCGWGNSPHLWVTFLFSCFNGYGIVLTESSVKFGWKGSDEQVSCFSCSRSYANTECWFWRFLSRFVIVHWFQVFAGCLWRFGGN